jgi:hypothetical protein
MVMNSLENGRVLSRKEKLKKEHGVKVGQHIWSAYGQGGMSVGFNSTDYLSNIDISQGRDSQFSTIAGQYLGERNNSFLGKYGYTAIKPQLVNLMPKFVNLIHGKLMDMEYDIGVDVIDAASMDEKEQVKNMLTAWTKLKDSASKVGVIFDKIKEESGMQELPDTTEDVQIMMSTFYKHYEAMKAELELVKVHNVNDWKSIKSKFIMELLQQGIAGVRTFVDGYGAIREEFFPMNRFIGSYQEGEDFNSLQYAGLIDYLTPEQFFCEAKDSLPEKEILELIKKYAADTRKDTEGYNTPLPSTMNSKQLYIRVLRFQKLEEDIENYVELEDEMGNKYMSKRKENFRIAPEEQQYYDSGRKALFSTSITTKYGGVWVIGSDCVYDYGIIQEGNDVKLDYHIYAPGYRFGKVSSVVSQIKEPVYMFSVAWSRLKHIVGQGWNGTIDFNVDMMYNMSLGKGGKPLDPKDVIDLFIMQGISLSKGKQNLNDPNSGKAINIISEGLMATDFISIMNLCIETIRNIIGVNELADASTPAPGTLNGVMEMANQSAEHAIAHYYRAYNSVYRRASLAILGYWKNIPSNEAWTREYIIGLEASTTRDEWMNYNAELAKLAAIPLIEGGITVADKFELQWPNIKNLKQGEMLAKLRIRKNIAQAQTRAEEATKIQIEGNTQNIQETLQADLQRYTAELQAKLEYERGLTVEVIKRQGAVNEGMIMGKKIEMQGRLEVADVQGKDSLIKEAQRSNSDQVIQEQKNQIELLKAQIADLQHQKKMEVEEQKIAASKQKAAA